MMISPRVIAPWRALLLGLVLATTAQAAETLHWGRLGDVTIYRPEGAPKSVVLFLSGDGGWNLGVRSMADALAREGALVAGIDLPHYQKELRADDGSCVYPAGELEDFAHFLESKLKLPEYRYPLLAGYSSGASLAYAVLAQAPSGTFAGALSLGFCPELDLSKPLCARNHYRATPKAAPHPGFDFVPNGATRDPWIVLQGEADETCAAAPTRAFATAVGNAEVVLLPKVGHGYSVEKNWMPQFLAAFKQLAHEAPQTAPAPLAADASVAGLPLVEVPASAGSSDLVAVLITGDGGWAGLDQDVAAALAARGVPVVALNSLKYYWTAHDAAATAHDVDRILRAYLKRWGKRRALLLGYSQGADVVPFVLNRLSADTRARIAGAAVIGLSEQAVFEFHFANWMKDPKGLATRPEVEKLEGLKLGCIYGAEEHDSPCPKLDAHKVAPIELPGGHHFNGDYDKVAKAVLGLL